MVPSTGIGIYWVKGKGKELWPTLDSKCLRQEGDPLPGDTVATSKATLAPCLAPGCTQDLQILRSDAPVTPHAYDSQLS